MRRKFATEPNGLTPAHEAVVQSLALPKTGLIHPEHAGIYKRASDANQIQDTFDFLFKSLTTCQ